MAKKNDWKHREGMVYSTNTEFNFNYSPKQEVTTLPPQQQQLRVQLDTHGRAGKQVTLVSGFVGQASDLEALTKLLKSKCGVGGAAKDGVILVQGDLRNKIFDLLIKEGYKAKKVGG